MKNKRYRSSNGIEMLECLPLNWQIIKTYAIECDPNPECYIIHIGGLGDMWQALLDPEKMIVSFCSLAYSADEVYRFKVESLEEASEMVLKFAKGMNQEESLKETIYTKRKL
jgi:hypothetical protein